MARKLLQRIDLEKGIMWLYISYIFTCNWWLVRAVLWQFVLEMWGWYPLSFKSFTKWLGSDGRDKKHGQMLLNSVSVHPSIRWLLITHRPFCDLIWNFKNINDVFVMCYKMFKDSKVLLLAECLSYSSCYDKGYWYVEGNILVIVLVRKPVNWSQIYMI
jgi:hypothetical protein